MNTLSDKNRISIIAIAILAVSVFILFLSTLSFGPKMSGASNPAIYPAQVYSVSSLVVNPYTSVYAFGTTTRESAFNCSSRIITTAGSDIRLSLANMSSSTLSATVGVLQEASSTEAYSSEEFGCGYVTILGLVSTSTITIIETH